MVTLAPAAVTTLVDGARHAAIRSGPLTSRERRVPSPDAQSSPPITYAPPPADDLPSADDLAPGPQFTLRGVLTGTLLGGLLSVCNLYAGLKVGLSFNMSVTAALVGYALWTTLHHVSGRVIRPWGLLENNINQTACSAGASVASAGLVTTIPALTLVTGQTLRWPALAVWVLSVCLLGVLVAVGVRRQMILVDKLPFPVGLASAETLRGLHARGHEALQRVTALLAAAGAALAFEIYNYAAAVRSSGWVLKPLAIPGSFKGIKLSALFFAVHPSALLVGVGGLIGFRACVSLLVGSVAAFGLLAPVLVEQGTIASASFQNVRDWLLWPGVTLMVVSALLSIAFSWRSILAAFHGLLGPADAQTDDPGEVSRGSFLSALACVMVLSVSLQVWLFDIPWWAAAGGVGLSFGLALMAGRVSGEIGITPVAQVGKVSQLAIGAVLPHTPAANLMSANVAGGAASQCADLLQDLKCGHLLGAAPKWQSVAQVVGVMGGAILGTAVYLLLVGDPAVTLRTPELPAPGVVGAVAVAGLFDAGGAILPAGAGPAVLIAAMLGVVLTLLEKLLPARARRWTVSGSAIGLACVLPPSVPLTIFIGGLIALVLGLVFKRWSTRFLVTVATGLVVGESLASVATGLHRVFAL